MTSTVTYLGALRTEATHVASSEQLITDAPKDNQGKGEALFSNRYRSYCTCFLFINHYGYQSKRS